MCGILALLGSVPDDVDVSLIKEAVSRRGPDRLKEISRNNICVCASVLRMRKVGAWQQPAVDETTGCILVWNGEWYDEEHEECDTYRVLELAVATTKNCVDAQTACVALTSTMRCKIRGEYAFALWIPMLQCLIFGRDPFGRRSLLWGMPKTQSDGTPKNQSDRFLLVTSVGSRENDLVEWHEVAPWNGLMAARLLPDGHVERLCNTTAIPSFKSANCITLMNDDRRKTAASMLFSTLSEAVRLRVCGASSSVGILFSGGLDSAVLAALAHKHAPPEEPIELINVAFGENHAAALRAPDRLAARRTFAELKAIGPTRDWRLVEVCIDRLQLRQSAIRIVSLIKPNLTHMDFNIAAAIRHAAHGVGTLYSIQDSESTTDVEHDVLRYASEERNADKPFTRVSPGPCTEMVPVGHGKPDKPCPNIAHPRCGLCGNCCRRKNKLCTVHPPRRTLEEKRLLRIQKEQKCQVAKTNTPLTTSAEKNASDAEGFLLPTDANYVCKSRLLLLGMGADELLAGYSRHRTKYKNFGREALIAELDLDFNRIPQRNLGRDDRVVADAAREARFPFLDESVVHLIRSTFQIEDIADLDLAPGIGCKRVLRDVARLLGLEHCATLQKRAIQFGTRIALHSNKLAFGSNRQADGAALFSINTMLENGLPPFS